MPGDLHTHTKFSDGSAHIEELIEAAYREGLTHLAVTDHDTALSVNYAYENPVIKGIMILAATELTALDVKRGKKVHFLCYYPEITDELCSFFDLMADRRNKAVIQSIKELEPLYPGLTLKAAEQLAAQGGVIYKTHVMKILLDYGYTDGIYHKLFNDLFGCVNGRFLNEPLYESIDAVLRLIKNAKGVAVLAHPSVYSSMELARELAENGAIDGVEIMHPRNTTKDKQRLLELAQKNNLIITGGSDFHGEYSSRKVSVGEFTTENEEIEKIINLANKRRKPQ